MTFSYAFHSRFNKKTKSQEVKPLTAGTSRSSPPLTGHGHPPPREPVVARKVVVQPRPPAPTPPRPPAPTPPRPPAIHRKQTRVVTDQQRLRQPIPRVYEGGYIHVPDLAASYDARNSESCPNHGHPQKDHLRLNRLSSNNPRLPQR